jgi:hypothetical protein
MDRSQHGDQLSNNEIKPEADRESSENKIREVSSNTEDSKEDDADRLFKNDRYVWKLLLYDQT